MGNRLMISLCSLGSASFTVHRTLKLSAPRTLLLAIVVAGRMSIHGHASLASRRRPWRRSDFDEYQSWLFEIIAINGRY